MCLYTITNWIPEKEGFGYKVVWLAEKIFQKGILGHLLFFRTASLSVE